MFIFFFNVKKVVQTLLLYFEEVKKIYNLSYRFVGSNKLILFTNKKKDIKWTKLKKNDYDDMHLLKGKKIIMKFNF